MLSTQKSLSRHYLKSPDHADGINIEGLAAGQRRLYFGFRSPVVEGKALLLSVHAAALFEPGAELAPRLIQWRSAAAPASATSPCCRTGAS